MTTDKRTRRPNRVVSVVEALRPIAAMYAELNRSVDTVFGDVFDVKVVPGRVSFTLATRSPNAAAGYPCVTFRVVHWTSNNRIPTDLYRKLLRVSKAKGNFTDREWPVVEVSGHFSVNEIGQELTMWSTRIELSEAVSPAGRWFNDQLNRIDHLNGRVFPAFYFPSRGYFLGRCNLRAAGDIRWGFDEFGEVGMGARNVGDMIAKLDTTDFSGFDHLVISRGGGSEVGLFGLCDADLVLAVAAEPIPCVIAVGHNQDKPLIERAGLAVDTPTRVGAVLGSAREQADAELQRTRCGLDRSHDDLGARRELLATELEQAFASRKASVRSDVRRRWAIVLAVSLVGGGLVGWRLGELVGAALGAVVAVLAVVVGFWVVKRFGTRSSDRSAVVNSAPSIQSWSDVSLAATERIGTLRWSTQSIEPTEEVHQTACQGVRTWQPALSTVDAEKDDAVLWEYLCRILEADSALEETPDTLDQCLCRLLTAGALWTELRRRAPALKVRSGAKS